MKESGRENKDKTGREESEWKIEEVDSNRSRGHADSLVLSKAAASEGDRV